MATLMSTLLFWFSQGETKENQQYKNNMINGNKFNLVFFNTRTKSWTKPNPTQVYMKQIWLVQTSKTLFGAL